MAKRKAAQIEEPGAGSTLRRSSRRISSNTATQDSGKGEPKAVTPGTKQTQQKGDSKAKSANAKGDAVDIERPAAKKSRSDNKKQTKAAEAKGDAAEAQDGVQVNSLGSRSDEEHQYWLLKAEPETRLENGVDVKFSIDDLAAKTKPEPWDGIRAYAARNNLRAMKKGDLAFFYHSNCKVPGIVGTMEIVQEHSPDLSAHDPKAPYYDSNSKPDDPRWSVVHVKFRSKFAQQISLPELRAMGAAGQPLENMQMLKQSRLSVSRVSASEWEHINHVAEQKEESG